eukprot:m.62907 g.62907  ORF g.62907 m.62907 type:complete len:1127 (+) comp11931_c0_seq5:229-3609(+)
MSDGKPTPIPPRLIPEVLTRRARAPSHAVVPHETPPVAPPRAATLGMRPTKPAESSTSTTYAVPFSRLRQEEKDSRSAAGGEDSPYSDPQDAVDEGSTDEGQRAGGKSGGTSGVKPPLTWAAAARDDDDAPIPTTGYSVMSGIEGDGETLHAAGIRDEVEYQTHYEHTGEDDEQDHVYEVMDDELTFQAVPAMSVTISEEEEAETPTPATPSAPIQSTPNSSSSRNARPKLTTQDTIAGDYETLWPSDDVYEVIDDDMASIAPASESSLSIAVDRVLECKPNFSRMSRCIVSQESETGKVPRPPSMMEVVSQSDHSLDSLLIPIPQSLQPLCKSTTCSGYANTLLQQGYLEKRGNVFLKTAKTGWAERFCIVRDSTLTIYARADAKESHNASASSSSSTAAGATIKSARSKRIMFSQPLSRHITLRRLGKAGKLHTFSVDGLGVSMVLGTQSEEEQAAWLAILDSSIRRDEPLTASFAGKMSGWCWKSKHGFRRRRWLALVGCVIFYSHEQTKPPLGRIQLGKAKLMTFDADSCSDPEDDEEATDEFCLEIINPKGVHHLMFDSRDERDRWAFFCGGVIGRPLNVGTEAERLMLSHLPSTRSKAPVNPFWETAQVFCSDEPLVSPMTTLPTEALKNAALDLWKEVQMFTQTKQDDRAIKYHISSAQQMFKKICVHRELFPELYLQLVKATNPGESMNCSFSHYQAWQLLALSLPQESPGKLTYKLLLVYFRHQSKSSNGIVRSFAQYCRKSLLRVIECGRRVSAPSVVETEAMILRNPGDYSHPLSIPVFLANGNHFVSGFDGSTSFEELSSSLCNDLGIRPTDESGYAMVINDPEDPDGGQSHTLRVSDKVADVLAQWEYTYKEAHSGRHVECIPVLSFRRRLYIQEPIEDMPEIERVLLCYDINGRLVQGEMAVSEELLMHLAGILCQIEWGDLDAVQDVDSYVKAGLALCCNHGEELSQFAASEQRSLTSALTESWRRYHSTPVASLAIEYLQSVQDHEFFHANMISAVLYPGYLTANKLPGAWVAVKEEGLDILSPDLRALDHVTYSQLKRFGSVAEEFQLEFIRRDKGQKRTFSVALESPQVRNQLAPCLHVCACMCLFRCMDWYRPWMSIIFLMSVPPLS